LLSLGPYSMCVPLFTELRLVPIPTQYTTADPFLPYNTLAT
jgi:hypothetical protein